MMENVKDMVPPLERDSAMKALLERHGNDLGSVIAGTYLEIVYRLAALEKRIAELESNRKRR
jgi:hypothetical protein